MKKELLRRSITNTLFDFVVLGFLCIFRDANEKDKSCVINKLFTFPQVFNLISRRRLIGTIVRYR